MTYKEWITKTVARFQITADDAELILENQIGIIPDKDAKVDIRIAKKALVNEFAMLIPLADIAEGGYSISWKWDAIKYWYRLTCAELGIEPVEEKAKPKIRNKSFVW